MANQTRYSFYKENEEIIDGYKWVSTLDRRACLVCGNLDGKKFKSIEDIQIPPLHYNCRCLLLPIIKGYEDLDVEGRARSSETISYSEWFDEQSENVKRGILGESRYEMYSKGKIKLKGFVNNGRVLTLDELKKR